MGVELVQDPFSKAPLDARHKLHARVKKEAMAHGLLCYPMGGTVDGQRGDHVLLAPPFIASHDDLADIASTLRASIDAAIESL